MLSKTKSGFRFYVVCVQISEVYCVKASFNYALQCNAMLCIALPKNNTWQVKEVSPLWSKKFCHT